MRTIVRNDVVIEHYLHRAWLAAGGAEKRATTSRRREVVAKSSTPSILRDDDAVALLVKNARERQAHDARMAWGGPVELNALGRPMAKAGRADPISGFVRALNEARRTPLKPGFGFGNGSGR
jgi:hypothetical protein